MAEQEDNVVEFESSEEAFPYTPGALLSKTIGSAPGIVKDEPVRRDQPYAVEGELFDGDAKVLTTGEAAQQSIQQQMTVLPKDEFFKQLYTGEIPTVSKIPKGKLQKDLLLLELDSVSPENKEKAQRRLDNAYLLYQMDSSAPQRPAAFGRETGEGTYVFAPTESAKQDPKELTAQESIFNSQSRIAKISRNAFKRFPDLTEDDNARIENILIQNLATGTFWNTLSEKMYDETIRGSGELLNLATNYLGHAIEAGAAATLSKINPFYTYRGFAQQWADTAEQREQYTQNLRRYFLEPVAGIRTLSQTMNIMIRRDLENQLENGTIDQETFDRITKTPQVKDPETGNLVSGPRAFVTEELAYTYLDDSMNQLAESEEYAVHLLSSFFELVGVGKARKISGQKFLDKQDEVFRTLERKVKDGKATEGQAELFGAIKNMGPVQRGAYLKSKNQLKRFNKRNAEFALGINVAEENISRINTEIVNLQMTKSDYVKRGFNRNSPEVKDLDFKINRLQNMVISTAYTGRFMPIVKEQFKDAVPLAAFKYFASEEDSFLRQGIFGDDRFAAEGVAALSYLLIGKPVTSGVGKTAYWLNHQVGDLQNMFLVGVEELANLPFTLLQREGIRGTIANRDMRQFEIKYKEVMDGENVPLGTRRAIQKVMDIAGKLRPEDLFASIESAQRSMSVINRLVMRFKPEDRAEMRTALVQDLSRTLSMDWLKSVRNIEGFKIDGKDVNSVSKIDQMVHAQRMLTLKSEKSTRLVNLMKEKLAGITNVDDAAEANRFLSALIQTNTKNTERITNKTADIVEIIKQFKESIVKDPTIRIPDDFLTHLDEMSAEMSAGLKQDVSNLKGVNTRYLNNVKLLAERSEASKIYRDNRNEHLKITARNTEIAIDNKIKRMHDAARSGFIDLDIEAAKMGVTIPVNKMIDDLMEFAPRGDLDTFFGKSSAFFTGPLGKKMYRAFNNMAKRSLESMENNTYSELHELATTPGSPFFVAEKDVKPLDIMLKLNKMKNDSNVPEVTGVPEFLASPGEVMDVYSAFMDYAFRIKDDFMKSNVTDYADNVESIIPEPILTKWKQARETYQNNWFDKLRTGSPLEKIHYSKKGPVKAQEPKQKEIVDPSVDSEDSFKSFEQVGEGEEIPEEALNNRFFSQAYKGKDNPLTGFDDFGKAIDDALYNKKGGMENLELSVRNFIESFSEFDNDVFDLTDTDAAVEFKFLKSHLSEIVHVNFGYKIGQYLDKDKAKLDIGLPKSNVLDGGGYDWERIQNIKQVQDKLMIAAKVPVEGGGTKIIKVKLVDLDQLAKDQASIEELIVKDAKIRDKALTYKTNIVNKTDAVLSATTTKVALPDEVLIRINQMSGTTGDPKSFFTKYVLNGTEDGLDALVTRMNRELGDSFQVGDVTYDTADVIDRGISNLIVNGMFQIAEVGPLQGRTYASPVSGKQVPVIGFGTPEELLNAMDKPEVENIFKRFVRTETQVGDKINTPTKPISDDHYEMLRDTVEYLVSEQEYEVGKVVNMVRGMGMNQLISRSFNLARGMVSPQYVAAEFAVSLASHAGLDLMKLAAKNEVANELILDLMLFPKRMTKADLNNFKTLVNDFIVTELGALGMNFGEVVDDWAVAEADLIQKREKELAEKETD